MVNSHEDPFSLLKNNALESVMYIKDAKIYNIVSGATYGEHTLELVPDSSGVVIYTLVFG